MQRSSPTAGLLGCSVSDLPTPCLTLDRTLLEENLSTLQTDVRAAGKTLRAHAKSHKCSQLARRQLEHGATGICAAKLSEAEGLAADGITGLLVTGPIVSAEAHERLARCVASGADLIITLDDVENARAISAALGRTAEGRTLRFLLDVEVGQGRTGVAPGEGESVAAELAKLPHLQMIGIQAYAGHVQHIIDREERHKVNAACLAPARDLFQRLRGNGVEIFSIGGTGSYEFDLEMPEVTEVQSGSYALMDADYLAVEPSQAERWRFHPALALRSRVMSARQKGFVTVDAGLKSLYHDGPAPLVVQPVGGSLVYDWFGDEYGRISGSEADLAPLKVGTMVSLVVSHCDPTVNLFDAFYLTEDEKVVDIWPINLRGHCF